MPSTTAGEPPAPQGQVPPASAWAARLVALARPRRMLPGAMALARRHWLVSVLLAAGLVLRILAQMAYQPAILYIDSTKYLLGAYPGDDPPGYGLALKPLLVLGNLALVAAAQHLLGLAMAVTLYAVLLRRGVPRWLSALATAPVLLDGYQIQIEQMIMPNVMFEVLIVTALAVLLWAPRPRLGLVIICGLALGGSATAFQPGEVLVLPVLLYLLITIDGWRRRLQQAAALCAAFALPVLFGSYKNYVSIHHFGLAPYSSGTYYGRMAAAADCATLKLPADERFLCPTAAQKRLGPDQLDHGAGSPIKNFHDPALVKDFWHQVVLQQPLNVAASIGKDALKLFALTRDGSPGDPPISRWQFQGSYRFYPPYVALVDGRVVFGTYNTYGVERTIGTGQQFGATHPSAIRPLAAFLRAYQLDGGYTPGPLYALTALAGLAGSIAALRRRRQAPAQRATAQACLLFFMSGAAILLASDIFEFSWRYQLPALITLPPAGALAFTLLLTRRRRTGEPEPAAARPAGQRPGDIPQEQPGSQRADLQGGTAAGVSGPT